MLEKIGRFAETLATSAGQSRRDFLGCLGKRATAVAGLVGALLLIEGETIAGGSGCTGACRYTCPNGQFVVKGCRSGCTCTQSVNFRSMTCFLSKTTCAVA